MQTSHFEAQSGYEHTIVPVILTYDDRAPFLLEDEKFSLTTPDHLKSPQALQQHLAEDERYVKAVVEHIAQLNSSADLLGFCAQTHLYITECEKKMPDLNGLPIPAPQRYPFCSVLWGVFDTAKNGVSLIRFNDGYPAIKVNPDWGRYLILPPTKNPAGTLTYRKTA